MKTLIRITDFVIKLLGVAIVIVVVMATCSCTSVKYVPAETIKTDSIRVVDVQRDSIFVMDSVFIREKADTVFITKWRVEFREALRVDTFQVHKVDSVQTIVEVEKKLTKWQQTKMDIGVGALWVAPVLIVVGIYILYRKLKK